MESKFYRRVIDRNTFAIDQSKENSRLFRFSWFEDNHYQCEFFIDIFDDEWDRPELQGKMDWWHAITNVDWVSIYFSYNNQYLIIELTLGDGWHTITRTYDLEELYNNARA